MRIPALLQVRWRSLTKPDPPRPDNGSWGPLTDWELLLGRLTRAYRAKDGTGIMHNEPPDDPNYPSWYDCTAPFEAACHTRGIVTMRAFLEREARASAELPDSRRPQFCLQDRPGRRRPRCYQLSWDYDDYVLAHVVTSQDAHHALSTRNDVATRAHKSLDDRIAELDREIASLRQQIKEFPA